MEARDVARYCCARGHGKSCPQQWGGRPGPGLACKCNCVFLQIREARPLSAQVAAALEHVSRVSKRLAAANQQLLSAQTAARTTQSLKQLGRRFSYFHARFQQHPSMEVEETEEGLDVLDLGEPARSRSIAQRRRPMTEDGYQPWQEVQRAPTVRLAGSAAASAQSAVTTLGPSSVLPQVDARVNLVKRQVQALRTRLASGSAQMEDTLAMLYAQMWLGTDSMQASAGHVDPSCWRSAGRGRHTAGGPLGRRALGDEQSTFCQYADTAFWVGRPLTESAAGLQLALVTAIALGAQFELTPRHSGNCPYSPYGGRRTERSRSPECKARGGLSVRALRKPHLQQMHRFFIKWRCMRTSD